MRPGTRDERRRLRTQAAAIVAREYRRPLTLAQVARDLGVSPRALQRAYALDPPHGAGAGAGPAGFADDLTKARLRAAAELLALQPIAVGDVARLVGYRGRAAFGRAFVRRYGAGPAAFRAAARAAAFRAAARTAAQHEQPQSPRARPLTRSKKAATTPGS